MSDWIFTKIASLVAIIQLFSYNVAMSLSHKEMKCNFLETHLALMIGKDNAGISILFLMRGQGC